MIANRAAFYGLNDGDFQGATYFSLRYMAFLVPYQKMDCV